MAYENPIFDRTQADVAYARANRNDPNHYKGAFNYIDMNRIAGNMHYIANLAGVHILTRREWHLLEKPTQSEIETLLTDLARLRNALSVGGNIPERPIYHYEKINQIERLLYDLAGYIARILVGHRRLGTFQLGGDLL